MAEREWFYADGTTRHGPVPESALRDLVRQGTVGPETLVWTQGMPQWQRAEQVPGLTSSGEVEPASAPPAQTETYAAARPTCVTVFGILNIVFGTFGLLCTPIALLGMNMRLPGMPDYGSSFKTWTVFSVLVGVVVSVALIAFGVGLLRGKPWGRVGSIVYGWFQILWGIVGVVVNVKIVLPALQRGMGGAGEIGMIGGVIGGVIGGIMGLIYPVLLIIFMNRRDVKDAFAASSGET